MLTRPPDCPRCKRRMEPGYVLDRTSGYTVATWVAGAPERSRWTGLKIKNRPNLPVTTYRCPHCGRLESFAFSD